MIWEHDTWFWGELGIVIGPDGRKWWFFGYEGQARPVPSWLQWLPTFRFRYPDKVAHCVVHFVLTYVLVRYGPPWTAYVIPPLFGLWYELKGYASWKDLLANTVGWLAALWWTRAWPLR